MDHKKGFGRFAAVVAIATACALASIVLPLSGCSTLNVSDNAEPLFDAGDIAPVNLSVPSLAGGGVSVEIDSRGPALAEGMMVFADGSMEEATLSGVTTVWESVNTVPLVCVMVRVQKDDYWYFDNSKGDYWYFDNTGQRMTMEQGAVLY
ncbi:MAG: hypothetical protein M3R04_00085, partial [bacterium]|nr:hypothetical protein [bacterium]